VKTLEGKTITINSNYSDDLV